MNSHSPPNKLFFWLACAVSLLLIGVIVFASEVYLRKRGTYATVEERWQLPNNSRIAILSEPWLYLGPKNKKMIIRKDEFHQEIWSNSQGFTGHEFPTVQKRKNEKRIFFVGDSFGVGLGDPERGGFVRQLSENYESPKLTILNASVIGSDPVLELSLIEKKLINFHPDAIVMLINSSDLYDIKIQGGSDRFTSEGWQKPQQQPLWGPLFYNSHLVRAFVIGWLRYSWELLSPSEDRTAMRQASVEIVKAAKKAHEVSSKFGSLFVALILPDLNSVNNRSTNEFLKPICPEMVSSGIQCIDLTPKFLEATRDDKSQKYFWPVDLHFTPAGYKIMADIIPTLEPLRQFF